MNRLISSNKYIALIPLLIMLGSHLLPAGSDPRGFGPAFAGGVLSVLVSGVLGVYGIVICFLARRAQMNIIPTVVATLVAAVPALVLLVGVISDRA